VELVSSFGLLSGLGTMASSSSDESSLSVSSCVRVESASLLGKQKGKASSSLSLSSLISRSFPMSGKEGTFLGCIEQDIFHFLSHHGHFGC
jgi:hypothetical protein